MPPCPDCSTSADLIAHFGQECVDPVVRGGVTPETIRSDLALVFDYAKSQRQIDPKRIAVFAHSEGTLNTARLIAERRIQPRALVFMGLMADSPAGIVHWQLVDRYLRILSWDADHDGILTNAEVEIGFVADPYFRDMGIPIDSLKSPTGSWTEESFKNALETGYEETKQAALSPSDTAPYGLDEAGGIVIAPQSWWKQFFTDRTAVANLLTAFPGPIFAHNGTRDSQTPADLEFPFMKERQDEFAVKPVLRSYPEKGHSLGESPLYGPMAPEAKDAIVADILTGLE